MKSSLRIIYSLIVFVLGIVLLSALTVLLIYENRQTQLTFVQVTRSDVIQHSLEKLLSRIRNGESSHRSFIITGDSTQLGPYTELNEIHKDLQTLDSLLSGDRKQLQDLATLRELYRHRQSSMAAILQKNLLKKDKNDPDISRDLEIDRGRMLHLQQVIERMQNYEEMKRLGKQEDVRRQSALPAIIGIGISIFSILIFILAFYFTNAELKKSIHLNDELEAKNIQLEKYAHELGSFTNIASHDMQEPLRKIELFISLIQDREQEGLPPRAAGYFEKIKESVARMRQQIFSILSFSLADQVRNVKEKVDLNLVLNETIESLRVYIKDTNAVVISEPLPTVSGVRQQLVQLFQNLVSNSLKYKRPDVIPEITITTEIVEGKETESRELSRERKYYKINFQDNGTGFDQQYVDRIFDIFQRHVRKESNGFGMGLSICKKIAQNHEGTIVAESEINKGALFSFYLPLTEVDSDAVTGRS